MKIQKLMCGISLLDIDYWEGDDIYLPPNEVYLLSITYPFKEHGEYEIKTGKGLGLFGLLSHIYKNYVKQYKEAIKNKNEHWHSIGDLVVEGIEVDHTAKKIILYMGS